MIAAHALRAKKRAMQKARVIIQISCIYMWWNGNNDIWNSMSSNWMKGFIYLRVSTWQFRPQLNLMDQFAIRLILFWLLHQGFIFLATQYKGMPYGRKQYWHVKITSCWQPYLKWPRWLAKNGNQFLIFYPWSMHETYWSRSELLF
jgi:hypothetical protein